MTLFSNVWDLTLNIAQLFQIENISSCETYSGWSIKYFILSTFKRFHYVGGHQQQLLKLPPAQLQVQLFGMKLWETAFLKKENTLHQEDGHIYILASFYWITVSFGTDCKVMLFVYAKTDPK